jgi:hypothetical protein
LDAVFEGLLAGENSATATTASAASTSAIKRPVLTVWLVGEFTQTPMYHGASASLRDAVPVLGFSLDIGRDRTRIVAWDSKA